MANFTSKNETFWTKRYVKSQLGEKGQIFADVTFIVGGTLAFTGLWWPAYFWSHSIIVGLTILGVRWFMVSAIKKERDRTYINREE